MGGWGDIHLAPSNFHLIGAALGLTGDILPYPPIPPVDTLDTAKANFSLITRVEKSVGMQSTQTPTVDEFIATRLLGADEPICAIQRSSAATSTRAARHPMEPVAARLAPCVDQSRHHEPR